MAIDVGSYSFWRRLTAAAIDGSGNGRRRDGRRRDGRRCDGRRRDGRRRQRLTSAAAAASDKGGNCSGVQ